MKLSEDTGEVLKNFSQINPNLLVKGRPKNILFNPKLFPNEVLNSLL